MVWTVEASKPGDVRCFTWAPAFRGLAVSPACPRLLTGPAPGSATTKTLDAAPASGWRPRYGLTITDNDTTEWSIT